MSTLSDAIALRRTFAIISHPDAGKTTLTEKLLMFGGAIQMAGAVRARGEQRRTRSDWMAIEKERGISVSASVMSFEYAGLSFNLLDTPGHEDFSEDTYRTLTAVDSAVMVLDAAKGIETQTLKLFEVCRLRDVPIITFVNKVDREGRETFDLLHEVEKTLALDVCPVTWPIGMGRDLKGVYDLVNDRVIMFDPGRGDHIAEISVDAPLDSPRLDEAVGKAAADRLREEVELVRGGYPEFDLESFLAGHLTPVFFGSALKTFGVAELLKGIGRLAPPPISRKADTRTVEPDEAKVTGFVFKVQANMDPNHRDRIAFFRICSGRFRRGMKMKHVRSGKVMALVNPVFFLARDRELAEEAFPGDIMGIPNHGQLRIGDTLSESEDMNFLGIPTFAPEVLRRVRLDDPMKAKQLKKALEDLAEEGVSQVFKPLDGSTWIVGVVGPLQFDVLTTRIESEYNIKAGFEDGGFVTARWVAAESEAEMKRFMDSNKSNMAEDRDGAMVYLARNSWQLNRAQQDFEKVRFTATREQH
ncbi:peptide chain release factor RF-3 [Paramagnetospirillum caucaseum]|uniref:Peptide chain release factor 3 n=1 Tax=Paramagnetospirillum caucaseum TaxID=1244869 RepID=M3AFN5_9PROT|nr:peptide chain release factor 3 [Paramagnetospirillum caucaseum]EME71628.1 peptide chain release factor RF-3 [Paramagnetospirillum caucaseum]